jgi:hypothetical protein
MVTLFITALAIVFIVGIGLYLWQKSAPAPSENVLPPPLDPRSLFSDPAADRAADQERLLVAAHDYAQQLIARAEKGERSALQAATETNNAELYDRVLTALVQHADSDAKLLALMSYVTTNELRVNGALAKAAITSWQKSPDRHATAKALHFAALSDDAELYREATEYALQLWREGKIEKVSAPELSALFDGEFWILSSRSRSSGAGFVLKRTLASARRELEAAGATNGANSSS